MLQIAVTGGIACGKSLVGEILSAHGATVRDTDDMAHHLVMRDTAVSRKIIEQFGADILDSEGRIDRTTLGNIVFSNAGARQQLNRIVHPAVKAMCDRWLARQKSERGMAVLIVPLLYEAGMDAGWNTIVCVACSRTTQLLRLRNRGLSTEQAQQRIAAQMGLPRQMEMADYVIFNDGDRSVLNKQTKKVMDRILERNER